MIRSSVNRNKEVNASSTESWIKPGLIKCGTCQELATADEPNEDDDENNYRGKAGEC